MSYQKQGSYQRLLELYQRNTEGSFALFSLLLYMNENFHDEKLNTDNCLKTSKNLKEKDGTAPQRQDLGREILELTPLSSLGVTAKCPGAVGRPTVLQQG